MSSDASGGTVAACHTGDAATTTALLLPHASDTDAPLLHQVHADEISALTARHAHEERALTQLHAIEDTTYQAVLKEAANVDTHVADTACPAYYVALHLKHKREQSALRKVQLAESVLFCHAQRDQYDAFVRRQERARAALAAKQRHEIECAMHDADDPTFVELLYRDLRRDT
ncbi:hypothetical protein SPRG_05691 [Saprolegnia parasitica CBS 223.65]|uniref:Uncharacterized protein n=1 Tax=Saprolegnia parasitica (strain CBS 223.65) TaxID=695850 RepID=A0A067CHU4_SAPPC|nr:hypothetical protein SPRG_05691 [Saprolegnia parasitica CBS 223.65]KDO28730.1 hypothetical protein SPRG_05691 [Saprolegnia parasitica CBS 223.65]|eukprot:XP_012200370.1 hypothetical protein SPRG_05691 [Saprolegnia parasitica CBS 223.65]